MKNISYPINLGFFYGYSPSGHQIAAKAISQFFPESIVKTHYFNLSQIYPYIGPFFAQTYFKIIQKTPYLWNYLYDNKYLSIANENMKHLIPDFYIKKIIKEIVEKKINAIVNTHALASILTSYKLMPLNGVKRFAVLTDISPHSFWDKNCDKYYVPTKYTFKKLICEKIEPEKIAIFGMPIRKEFNEKINTEEIKKRFNIKSIYPTFLITGGNHGIIELEEIIEAFRKTNKKINLIIMCGNNKNLIKKLVSLHTRNLNFYPLPYIKNPAEIYAISDCIIGKSGGMTIFETAFLKKPLIVYSPIPGQEERNLNYLKKHNACFYAEDSKQLYTLIEYFFSNKKKFREISENMSRLNIKNASFEIANDILKEII